MIIKLNANLFLIVIGIDLNSLITTKMKPSKRTVKNVKEFKVSILTESNLKGFGWLVQFSLTSVLFYLLQKP